MSVNSTTTFLTGLCIGAAVSYLFGRQKGEKRTNRLANRDSVVLREFTTSKENRSLILRTARKSDVEQILRMIRSLAEFERELDSVQVDVETLERDGFSSQSLFETIVVEDKQTSKLLGFALYFNTYSTWTGRCCYLEDLYIDSDLRGEGVGTVLLSAVVDRAKNTGCARVSWQALDWNTKAIGFYKSVVGAAQLDEWCNFRLDREAMNTFLESTST